ncbi:hypothetical protein ACVWWG_004968 [Bradyrhizobium sp. LB7.2]
MPASPARAASIVALSASRLVWLAMVVDQLDHVANAGGGLGQLGDAPIGALGLLDGDVGDTRRFLHLTADLGDRGGHFLARGRHRLYVGGSLFGGRRHDGGKPVAALGGLRQRVRGCLELGCRRRHGLDDLADRALEIVGELLHVGLALLATAHIGCDLLSAQPLGLRHVGPEHLDGTSHLTDLVPAPDAGNGSRKLAARKPRHRTDHAGKRFRDRASQEEADRGEHHNGDAEGDGHPQAYGIAGRSFRRLGLLIQVFDCVAHLDHTRF